VLFHLSQELTSAAFGAKPDFGGVVLGIESQLSLAGIDPSRLSQVDHHLHFVEAACCGEQAGGELQSSESPLARLWKSQRRHAARFPRRDDDVRAQTCWLAESKRGRSGGSSSGPLPSATSSFQRIRKAAPDWAMAIGNGSC